MLAYAVSFPQTLVSATGASLSMLVQLLMQLCSESHEGTALPKYNPTKRNILFIDSSAIIVFGAFRRQGKQQKTLNNTAPQRNAQAIASATSFLSGYLLFFSFCCILTLLNLPLPHEISQIPKKSEYTIAYVGQHSNQHWRFFKSFIERPFV